MKKNYLLILAFVPFLLIAQVPKMVLYEGFSQASCPPCATANPGINALIEANLDKIVPIKYQTSWPGTDPMNQHNPTDVANRVSYYNISGVPGRRLNGKDINFSQTNIDAQYNENAAFTIDIDAEMSATMDTVFVSVTVTAQVDISTANFKTRIAVVEKEIIFDNPPGSNGEKRFTYIMKKFLPNANGLNMPANMEAGESVTFTDFWVHQNVYDIAELSVVAYVQNDVNVPVGDNKNVYQAGIRNVRIIVENDLDASLVEVAALSSNFATEEVCDFRLAPSILIRNAGNDNITSLDIRYRINDGLFRTYNWTGNLQTFERATIQLPSAPFFHDASGINVLEVNLTNPNGGSDQDLTNNTLLVEFATAKNASTHVRFTLSHDQYTDEITWELIRVSNQEVVYSGGPYTGGAGTKTSDFYLTSGDCYEFIIYDSYGDAQLGSATGVTLYDMINEVHLLQNFNGYGFEGRFNFGVNADQGVLVPDSAEVYLSLRNNELLAQMLVYPNPTTSVINLELEYQPGKMMQAELFDMTGRKIKSTPIEGHKTVISVDGLNTGVYFINVTEAGRTIAATRVMVAR
jgi:hypothetical protein